MPEVTLDTLPNGVRVITRTDPRFRTAALCVAVGFGSRHDPAGQGGIAHLLEHLLMSSPGPSGSSLAADIEVDGGHTNAITGIDLMLLHAQVLPARAADTMAALATAAATAGYGAEQLSAERQAVLRELGAAAADPADCVQDAFLAHLFPGHPLGRPVGGTTAEVEQATLEGVRQVHHNALADAPVALIAVGPLTAGDIRAAVQGSGIEKLPARSERRAEPAIVRAPEATTPDWPDEFCWMSIGGRSPAIGDPARHAYTVLAQLLGGGPASLLYRRLRTERGLGYHFQAWQRSYRDSGSWRVLAGSEPEHGPMVLQTVRECLAEVAAGPDPALLTAARRQSVFGLVAEGDEPLGQVIQLARGTYAGVDEWSLDQEAAALQAVTGADVRAAADALLDDLSVVVRPAKQGSER
jgi:predicted Zn-dependent peptidase